MLDERLIAEELMDDLSLDAETYHDVLHDLSKVNTVTLARLPTLGFLTRAVGDRNEFSVLDVGFGDGDMLRSIAFWARKRGKTARLVGIDLNPRSREAAAARTPADMRIDYRTGDYADLAGEGFDCIASSLVAHHMSRDQLLAFLRFMELEAQAGWFINDLHRHGFAYYGYPVLARLAGWHDIVRHDGRMSIARSYRPDEWPPLLAEAEVSGAEVRRVFPFRLCVEKLR